MILFPTLWHGSSVIGIKAADLNIKNKVFQNWNKFDNSLMN